VLLSAIGMVANIEGVLAPNLRVELDRNYVKVGDDYQTNVKGIYAAGDIIGPPWLAHVATFEAVNAVNGMFGHGKPRRVKNFPGCTYCQPQVASTGLTEKAAKEKGLSYKVGKFPFTASGKAVASAESEGFVKVISRREDRRDLRRAHHRQRGDRAGGRIWPGDGPRGDRRGDPPVTIHAHPTLSEALGEAALATLGKAIHT
jgi:dihydrolipoamide dehydrogenase